MFKRLSQTIQWIGKHFLGMLFLLLVAVLFFPKSTVPQEQANLQEIQLFGTIMDASKIVEEIEEAKNNPLIQGVLLNVNSPGGAVPPSIEISYAIKALQKEKPVIAYASGVMASGSYYSSIYADTIIANPGAIIGSIGVIMQSANIEELMKKVGIQSQVVKQGLYKEAGTFTRTWTPQERAELEQLTLDTYQLFVHDVAQARGLDENLSNSFANAHIFSAKRAKEVGLIDTIGIKSQAKALLIKKSHTPHPHWKEKSQIDTFIEKLTTKSIIKLEGYIGGLKARL